MAKNRQSQWTIMSVAKVMKGLRVRKDNTCNCRDLWAHQDLEAIVDRRLKKDYSCRQGLISLLLLAGFGSLGTVRCSFRRLGGLSLQSCRGRLGVINENLWRIQSLRVFSPRARLKCHLVEPTTFSLPLSLRFRAQTAKTKSTMTFACSI